MVVSWSAMICRCNTVEDRRKDAVPLAELGTVNGGGTAGDEVVGSFFSTVEVLGPIWGNAPYSKFGAAMGAAPRRPSLGLGTVLKRPSRGVIFSVSGSISFSACPPNLEFLALLFSGTEQPPQLAC
jgi:hypothetical protein